MKKLISSIAVVGLLGASTVSADSLSKNDSEFLGLTSNSAITLNSKEMVQTEGKAWWYNKDSYLALWYNKAELGKTQTAGGIKLGGFKK